MFDAPATFSGLFVLKPTAFTITPAGTTSDDRFPAQVDFKFAVPAIAAPTVLISKCCPPDVTDCHKAAFCAGVSNCPCVTLSVVPPETSPLGASCPPIITVPDLLAATDWVLDVRSRFLPVTGTEKLEEPDAGVELDVAEFTGAVGAEVLAAITLSGKICVVRNKRTAAQTETDRLPTDLFCLLTVFT